MHDQCTKSEIFGFAFAAFRVQTSKAPTTAPDTNMREDVVEIRQQVAVLFRNRLLQRAYEWCTHAVLQMIEEACGERVTRPLDTHILSFVC